MSKTYQEMKAGIEKDPAASYFLKDMLFEADRRDPVDVISDCEVLIKLMHLAMQDARSGGVPV